MPAWRSGSVYDLANAILAVKVKIVDAKGDALPNKTVLAPVNNLYASLFSDMRVSPETLLSFKRVSGCMLFYYNLGLLQ